MRKKLVVYGLASALGEAVYVMLVALFMENASKHFGQRFPIFSGAAILLIFVLSAAVSGALVLGKPILLYLENKKKEGIELFLITLGWMIALILILFAIVANF